MTGIVDVTQFAHQIIGSMVGHLLYVAAGSAVGGVLRYGAAHLSRNAATTFPFWTFGVNAAGSLLIGILSALLPVGNERLRLLLITGFCGGFTTFSAFSLETLELLQSGGNWAALANVAANVVVSIGLCLFGYWLGLSLLKP